tara:strand:+ start:175 stop:348 length:174 start_codon:yes stop_codon:yes gene_type:complete
MGSKAKNVVDWDGRVGSMPNDGIDSVKQIREIRDKLSKEPFDLEEMNNFADEFLERR